MQSALDQRIQQSMAGQEVPVLTDLLEKLNKSKGSDMFITVGAPALMKLDGKLEAMTNYPLTPVHMQELVYKSMNPKQKEEFEKTHEANYALSLGSGARFRVSAFYQRNQIGMVVRRIETKIPTMDQLELPVVLKKLVMAKNGIIIMVGATGTGKSTTLASMIDHRNRHSQGHIITIEDPIEFVHRHQGCVITQREIGIDTDNWENALKNTLRQAPDIIMMGEIRTRESMDYAVAFAETGHLVLCTLHANNANQAIDRIINFFPEERRHQLLMDLSLNLKGIVAQKLIPKIDGGRAAVHEILMASPYIKDLIKKGEVDKLKEQMKLNKEDGMQTFDMALVEAYKKGVIGYDDALGYADSENEVRLSIKLSEGGADKEGLGGLEILRDQKK